MTTLSAGHTGSIIESASALFGSAPMRSVRTMKASASDAKREAAKQERAMARRLEQLQAALGDTGTTAVRIADIKSPQVVVTEAATDGHAVRAGSPFLTSLVSALLGAGLMWLAMQPEQAPIYPAQPVKPAATAVAAATPAVVPLLVTKPEISDEKKISDFLENWRGAWMQRNTAAYLNAYSKDFAPADGSSRDTWVAARTKKLSTGAPIDIQISDLGIERINADQFKLTFLQDYASGSYREMARAKTLLVVREGDDWRIAKERLDEKRPATK